MTLNQNWSKVGGEARTEEYRTWRTQLGFGSVSDIDQIEYRYTDGRPLLAIELCVADFRSDERPRAMAPWQTAPSQAFFDQVAWKVSRARPQGRVLRTVAAALRIPLLQVLYVDGHLARLGVWVRQQEGPTLWLSETIAQYENRLRRVHREPPRELEGDQPRLF